VVLLLLVSLLALLLGSFPARNSDLWMHLAAGRRLAQGELTSAGWLYDLLSYGIYETLGGAGLVFAKALLVVGVALVLLRLSRTDEGWWLAALCTALALLAMGTRLLLQPATVSYLFLALTLWFVRERRPAGEGPPPLLPPWPLVVLFVVWVNVDGWFVLGLATVALLWLGQALDLARRRDQESGGQREGLGPLVSSLARLLVALSLLAAACLLNPAHVSAFVLPPELGSLRSSAAGVAPGQVTSPFQRAYFAHVGLSPAGLAYFPLLGLSVLSFVLDLPRWSWRRFLPWLGLALLSAVQVRAVPFFAVVAGPVLAWNLHSWLAARAAGDARPAAGGLHGLAVALGLLLVVCAWPGWLQGPPFEPRRWAVETPPALERGAVTTRRWHEEGKLGPEARGLHLSAETAHAFAWFCPQEKGVRDDSLASAIRGGADDLAGRMRSAGVNHIILYDADRGRLFAALDSLLADPQQWPVLYMEGDLIVFGWRDPAGGGAADPFRGWQLDLNGLAARPAEDKKAPRKSPEREPEVRAWWEAFWKPAPPRPIDRDEATLHLFHAEALRGTAPYRHQSAWQQAQAAACLGAAAGWAGPADILDAHRRLTLFLPLTTAPGAHFSSLPPTDQLAHILQQQFAFQRDDTSPALLHLAVRAARRALAANPDDAQAYLVLGESYLRLSRSTRERVWGEQMPELTQLRRAQASAALNQAVSLRPDFPQARLALSMLYMEMDYLDLALEHLSAYRQLVRKAGPPAGLSAEQFREQEAPSDEELARLAKEVEKRENKFAVATSGWKVMDQAERALRDGLAGKARDLLLESDIAAFGIRGMALELELLLKTGRPKTVLEWMAPEQEEELGPQRYHWLRAQALAATGDYALAQEECNQLAGSLGSGARGPQATRPREVMALLIGRRVLSEHARGGYLPDFFWRTSERYEFRNRIISLAQGLRREADVTVLRGLLALEQGDTDEAEIAFRVALSYWKDAASAASGGGLEFNGRAVAQGCLEWLQ
jgi:tetratricopeptide (TPR) repeat protein